MDYSLRHELVETASSERLASPDLCVTRVVQAPPLENGAPAPFTAVQLSNRAVGIGYNLFQDDSDAVRRYRGWDLASLADRPAGEVIQLFLADDLVERSVGLAALNAVCQGLFRDDPAGYGLNFDRDVLDWMAPGPDDVFGMVGYFPPTARLLLGRVKRLVVVEKSPALLAGEYPFFMTGDPSQLAVCSKVLITATTILNDTLVDLLVNCRAAEWVAVIGPSAGICPQPLFDLGAHLLGGTYIDRPEIFLERFASGARWGDAKRRFVIVRGGLAAIP